MNRFVMYLLVAIALDHANGGHHTVQGRRLAFRLWPGGRGWHPLLLWVPMDERLRRIARKEEELRRRQEERERDRRQDHDEEVQRKHALARQKLELKYSGREERVEESSVSMTTENVHHPAKGEQDKSVTQFYLGSLRQEESRKAEEMAYMATSMAQARLDSLYGPGAAVSVTLVPSSFLRKPALAMAGSHGQPKEGVDVDSAGGLPDEVWLQVLAFLGLDDLQACRGVCIHMRRLASDDVLWKPVISRLYPRTVERLMTCSYEMSWVERAMHCMRAGPWNQKGVRSTLALRASLNATPTALACRERLVAVAMSDCSVTILELGSPSDVHETAKHAWKLFCTGAVLCLAMSLSGRLLACGLEDGSVQVADIRAHAWVATMSPHSGRVKMVRFASEDAVFSFDSKGMAFTRLDTLHSNSLWIVGVQDMSLLRGSNLLVVTNSCCHVVSAEPDALRTLSSWVAALNTGESIVACASSAYSTAVVVTSEAGTRVLQYGTSSAFSAPCPLLMTQGITGAPGCLHTAQLQDDGMLLVALIGPNGELKTTRFDVSLPLARRDPVHWTVQAWLTERPTVAPALATGMVLGVDANRRLTILRSGKESVAAAAAAEADEVGGKDQQQLWESMVGKLAPLAPW